MIPKTIRWRLPLSYAFIALLAATVLGGVLLVTLHAYYQRQERLFLTRSASFVSINLAEVLAEGASPEELHSELVRYAFLTQAQVRYLDLDGNVLAESGYLDRPWMALVHDRGAVRDRLQGLRDNPVKSPGRIRLFFDLLEPQLSEEPAGVEPPTPMAPPSVSPFRMDRAGGLSLYDFRFGTQGRQRSDQQVTVSIVNPDDQTLHGYVQLSGLPDYAGETVSEVAKGWLVAGSIAVLLAAVVGWFVSRSISDPLHILETTTARMAGGELSVRATVYQEDEVGRLAAGFNKMAERIGDLVSTLQRFASDAAHELNTPIAALRNNLDLAVEEEDPAELRSLVQQGRSQALRLEKLANDLLLLARLDAGVNGIDGSDLDLRELVLQASEVYASQAEQSEIVLSLRIPDEPLMVQGNSFQLQRAVANLMDNAVKFTPPGGEIVVGLRADNVYATIWVEDNGIGIPENEIPYLFSGFHRARNALPYPGSGLGLAIVQRIVERHSGQVSAENTGSGARFTIQVPANCLWLGR